MTAQGAGLSHISSADLERLLATLSRSSVPSPVSRALLFAERLGHLAEPLNSLAPLEAFDSRSLGALVAALLCERQAHPAAKLDLVWTGGEAKTAYSRPTAAVVRELFESAERHVLVAGYSFDHGSEILGPLHHAMQARNVAVELYLHIERARRTGEVEKHIDREVASFFAANWRFGPPHPQVYIAPRCIEPRSTESLHAKCVVVDERMAVIGSANFTDRGQARNVEVGARIEDAGFARALVAQFRAATNAGVFRAFETGMETAKQ
jgi:hypothetical protein